MIEKLRKHLAKILPNFSEKKFLLAISGGVDSVVMVELFASLNLNFAVAHCNFQLRGVESDADERLVSILAARHQRPFFVKRFDTDLVAKQSKESIQMVARKLRYTWFAELAECESFDYIVTAHHKNDLVETMLLNLCKGTGYAGLVGIKVLNGNLLRPLLEFKKDDLLTYAQEHQLTWREDASNSLDKYQRNHLRLNVIPLLDKINPSADDSFSRTSEKINAAAGFIATQIQLVKNQFVAEYEDYVEIDYTIKSLGNDLIFVMSEILRKYNFDFYKCKQIAEYNSDEPGAIFESETHQLLCDRKSYIIVAKNQIIEPLQTAFEQQIIEFGGNRFAIELQKVTDELLKDKNIVLVPEQYLGAELVLRNPILGDEMAPFGMKGKRKKVADLLSDYKMPAILKPKVVVVEINKEIFSLLGIRASEKTKVIDSEYVYVFKKI
ncbi:MAG: tRNA lysidine(34) synthetase TilS [Cytophagales bacterium]